MAAVALAVSVLGASKSHALVDDPFTSYTQPANALVMPFDVTADQVTFLLASNLSGVSPIDGGAIAGVTTHWSFWSETCDHLADVFICLTLNDTVIVDPRALSAIDAGNNPIGPQIDLSGNRGFVVVTAYSTDEICSDASVRGFELVDDAIVGTYTFADTTTQAAFGNDAIGLGTNDGLGDFTELPPLDAFTGFSIQTFNPETLDDSAVVLLALRERSGSGSTAEFEVGPYSVGAGLRADLIFYDNLEIPTSLPEADIKCALFTSLIPGDDSLIPSTVSLLSSGFLRLDNITPQFVGEDRLFLYGIHGQAVGNFGGSSNIKYKVTGLF
ncbi:MAG: hypothetical protein AB1689_27470 [Thermodesulfobacteriota bacterium]